MYCCSLPWEEIEDAKIIAPFRIKCLEIYTRPVRKQTIAYNTDKGVILETAVKMFTLILTHCFLLS